MRNEKGFTMVEVLAALVIFSVAAVPATLAITRVAHNLKSADRVLAIQVAQDMLNMSLANPAECYPTERETLINGTKCRVVREITEGEARGLVVSVYRQKRRLAHLKGYVFTRE
ncbi:MAG: hypothetical protein A2268_02250 [Candidatus Raymondbacteria bacterium RifOxyA12_full_50_37]|uniref:Type II secretion system protein GspI n=1 Tax=Candidatus Raymondbacteria bacterium RIFOXYD12_FULL_49_13 TaxID=1817890 RepID=A0A1F7F5L2_UNCRA|nr:MAG: hypothetical protein A2350_07775 [Candidatus Raymondbacteria bacterium RifOxyB12_full_50_8]OGJ91276.1 MAG: hypothetical protein A2268_02250 [Candidatus Raymondbacteria bacterium RifOxyA12_full_50_37]OGJ92246.1 MAG: hypothetical protein A2248_11080 [Candidatus Raymondbacteria bacterium RIFOXYA2_FULL_49_16]OGJ98572.1 MAG: hypothetical protein A2453_06880 [Candidatus Raymondbacteria bacterium RIFOXYC2_FULL_50_21]OGK01873.1 MAG: hypothetical protein A2519_04775 [Candidatus Raymondbacteria b